MADIEPRILYKENTSYGIVNYDVDNAYPTRVREMIAASGTASKCWDRYAKFIEGQGFADPVFYKSIVNRKRLTMDKLLRKFAKDLAMFQGFAVQINYNLLYEPCEFNIINFEDCRLPSEENEERQGMIAVYDDWAKRRRRQIKKDDIIWYDLYNPDAEEIEKQIEKAGGFSKWKGQVFWYSADGFEYPLATCDAVLEDVDTDAQIQTFRNNSVRSGFLDHMLFVQKGKFESETEKEEFKQDLKTFQGAKKSTQIMLVEVEDENEVPELKPMPSTDADEKFKNTNQTTKESIIEGFGIPPVLLNQLVPGKLGTGTEIADAVNFYNLQTVRERILMEETLRELCHRASFVPVPKADNYSITEISFNNGVINNSR
ncbi:phage portal family protein [Pelobium manganitolerans]|uniref:hypothetical protein n=1 Tax=Pelobium manganitolerans TaxID=1842495 RepID=UPI0011C4293C|nr:hypothetical protein [Pelobium manganitolerans]